jgi:hypothetical protein
MLLIEIKMRKPDPGNPREYIDSEPAIYKYRRRVDWNDPKSVNRLKLWRRQIWGRNFGATRDGRQVWTEVERDYLFQILAEHLPDIGGRWRKIDWDMLANRFNERFEGIVRKCQISLFLCPPNTFSQLPEHIS